MSDDLRTRVLRLMWDEMNGWMAEFAYATHHISKALLDGRLTEKTIAEFPVGTYPGELSRAVAQTAGIPWYEDGPAYNEHRFRVDVSTEDVDIAVSALRAIPQADVCTNEDTDGCTWQLYPEALTEHGLTIPELREFWQGLTLLQAAQLLADVNDVPNYARKP